MKLLFFILTIILISCTSPSIKKIEKEQAELEKRIDSLEKSMKAMCSTDSILLVMMKPKPGSLLDNIENKK